MTVGIQDVKLLSLLLLVMASSRLPVWSEHFPVWIAFNVIQNDWAHQLQNYAFTEFILCSDFLCLYCSNFIYWILADSTQTIYFAASLFANGVHSKTLRYFFYASFDYIVDWLCVEDWMNSSFLPACIFWIMLYQPIVIKYPIFYSLVSWVFHDYQKFLVFCT